MASSTTARFCREGRPRIAVAVLSLALAWTLGTFPLGTRSAAAQAKDFLTFQSQLRPKPRTREAVKGDPQMLVQANEVDYDYTNERVSAVGNVQIYYHGSTLEADKVVYDQKTKRLHAEGNARLTEADGKVTYGQIIDLSEDYRDGFIDSLRLETPDQTRLAASRAERSSGNYTVFENGVYTACQPCKDDPKKPPLWQVKAARIIHNQSEKMIYFEDARLEFFGVPIAYMPYFSTPDPTVKRKSGFLLPFFSTSSIYGYSAEIPYYWAIAPNYDLTFSPRITTTQGPLLQAEWRQRFESGSFTLRGTGIDQLDKGIFKLADGSTSPGFRNWRGSLESSGQFDLASRWVWGWDAMLLSDRTYLQDYNLSKFQNINPFGKTSEEGVSQIYLAGRGDRSYFDTRAIHYLGFSVADNQRALPIIHPVTDYSYVMGSPILGGEFGYDVNLTSLSRESASFDAISQTAVNNNLCGPNTADPAVKIPANCLLRGIPGTYSRFSAEAHWRRQIIDSIGQVFTPFASVRADAASLSINSDPGVSNFIEPGDTDLVRAMPTVGLEYRFPFVGVESWGTQTIEPIAQVIARPDEPDIGKFPNEDAQSLVFDDSNLFRVNKFSGYDRIEGGGRANAGIQYIAQFNRGGSANILVGQSYQLFGTNSFAVGDTANTGLGSGLDRPLSDYVARATYQPNKIYAFTSRFRFDQENLSLNRLEVEGRADYDRWSASLLYGNYAAQPELGFLNRRQGVLGSSSVKLDANWVLSGAARYDLEAGKFDQTRVGLGYINDCFLLGLNYITSYTYYTFDTATATFSTVPQIDHRVMLQMSLRTLGGTGGSNFGGY